MVENKYDKNKNSNLTVLLMKKYGTRDLVLSTRLASLTSVQANFFYYYYTFESENVIITNNYYFI